MRSIGFFAIRRDAHMLADIRHSRAPNHSNCGIRKSLCAIFSWHFSSAVLRHCRVGPKLRDGIKPQRSICSGPHNQQRNLRRAALSDKPERQSERQLRRSRQSQPPQRADRPGLLRSSAGWRVVRAACFLAPRRSWPASSYRRPVYHCLFPREGLSLSFR
jgi:hypothetical protein